MESSKSVKIKMKCPECTRYIVFRVGNDGLISSICPHCKSIIKIKQISDIEKVISISNYM